MVLETRMSGLVPTIVCLLLLASQLRGQEQSVIYPDPSTKRQTEHLASAVSLHKQLHINVTRQKFESKRMDVSQSSSFTDFLLS